MKFTLAQIQKIIDKSLEGWHTSDPFIDSRLEDYPRHHYYKTFYLLAKELKPDLVVELGAWQCTAACCFASGYDKAKVITIDHHGDPGDEDNKKKCIETLALYPNLTYLQGWTWDVIGAVKQFNQPIDILFIDSWHMYEYAKKDWDLYRPLLSKNALVICDDIVGGNGPTMAGMLDFWNEFEYEKFLENRIHIGYPVGFLKYELSSPE